MKPSDITTYEDQINTYKAYLLDAYSSYCNNVVLELSISNNRHYLEQLQLKLVLLNLYVDIVLDYIEPTIEDDDNFTTYIEFKNVMRHTNRIMNTNFILDIPIV